MSLCGERPIVAGSRLSGCGRPSAATRYSPGGRLTGVSFLSTPLNAKRLELLAEVLPKGSAVLNLGDPGAHRAAVAESIDAAARSLGLVSHAAYAGTPQEIEDFLHEYRVPYRQLLGTEELQEAFDATQGLPTTFVIDGEGIIRTKILGSIPSKFEKLQETVDAALARR